MNISVQYCIVSSKFADQSFDLMGHSYCDTPSPLGTCKAESLVERGVPCCIKEKKSKAALQAFEDRLAKECVVFAEWEASAEIRICLANATLLHLSIQDDISLANVEIDNSISDAELLSNASNGIRLALVHKEFFLFGLHNEPRFVAITRPEGARGRRSLTTKAQPIHAPCVALTGSGGMEYLACTSAHGGLTLYSRRGGELVFLQDIGGSVLSEDRSAEILMTSFASPLPVLRVLLQSPLQFDAESSFCLDDSVGIEEVSIAEAPVSPKFQLQLLLLHWTVGVKLHARHSVSYELAPALCWCNGKDDKWVVCTDATVRLYHAKYRRTTSRYLSRSQTPYMCRYHPNGALLAIAYREGNSVQLLDNGLNAVQLISGQGVHITSGVGGVGLSLDSLVGLHSRIAWLEFNPFTLMEEFLPVFLKSALPFTSLFHKYFAAMLRCGYLERAYFIASSLNSQPLLTQVSQLQRNYPSHVQNACLVSTSATHQQAAHQLANFLSATESLEGDYSLQPTLPLTLTAVRALTDSMLMAPAVSEM
eukprot:NODE_1079_length_1670_cov_22.911212_g1012_i0.p1 GENE.NODE_1079_length_1670_cov_22.911212_g1012_i0~~NODE_1079_length_1670_cov_22.911212_g1012_i0.p1  ORF type:complete len:536 (+),score=142.22 NODE_1079_length_1670_cov_22.911212_g1012_i0:1-1608(+)